MTKHLRGDADGLWAASCKRCDNTLMEEDVDDISESVIGFDALYDSAQRCQKGVLWKDSTAYYALHAVAETGKLEQELKDGSYRAKKPVKFMVTHPKEREIVSIAFRDRVYQRSLNDNIIYPVMTRSFIQTNCACQRGKGTDFAREYIHRYMRKAYLQYGTDYYVLQCDIKGYYPNMRHEEVLKLFESKLDPWSYRAAADILTGQYDGDTGYNPGSQMVQIAGIALLDRIDHYIKERLRIKYYVRYMDDLILIHHDREYLEYCRTEVGRLLAEIGFELHPKKTRIYPITDGIRTLGFRHNISVSGKVTMTISPKVVKAERKKLLRLVHKAQRGELTKAKVDICYRDWRAHAAKADSRSLLAKMDHYYASLWKEEINHGNYQRNRRSKGKKD